MIGRTKKFLEKKNKESLCSLLILYLVRSCG